MATVISALISSGMALIVALYTVHVQQEKSLAVIELKIEELTKKVEKHNQLIERTYELEKQSGIQEQKIADIKGRIESLEKREAEA